MMTVYNMHFICSKINRAVFVNYRIYYAAYTRHLIFNINIVDVTVSGRAGEPPARRTSVVNHHLPEMLAVAHLQPKNGKH